MAASGAATGPDAARDAVAAACASLGGDPELVLFFPSGIPPEEAASQARDAAGSTPLAGMTGTGLIAPDGRLDEGCTALALGDGISAGVGFTRGAATDPVVAAQSATEMALARVEPVPGRSVLLLFLDTASGDQALAIDGAYRAAGARIPFAGGAAGGDEPAQFAAGWPLEDGVVAVAITAPEAVGVGIADGCRDRGVPGIVTRAEGRAVMRIDGRAAEEVYLEKIGMAGAVLDDGRFREVAAVHPLAQPELRGDFRIRHVMGRAGGGGLICATAIPENAAVQACEQTAGAVVSSGWDAVSDALAPLGGSRPRAAIAFDCAGRRAERDALDREAAAIIGSFGTPAPPFAGLYTRGEVGRIRGAKGDRNHALVVVALA